jgi:uncharacterized membrane protein YccC
MILQGLVFWLKVTTALSLTLWVGFELSIVMASSAAITVAILSDPDSGAVFSKSKWRFIGTILGGIFFVMLAVPFVQTPWLFLLGLALWGGGCYYVSNYFRNFQAYGALLAGYTASILLSDVGTSNNVVYIAIQRISEICLGVVCVAIVFGFTHIRKGISRLEPEMRIQAQRILEMASGIAAQPTAQTQVDLVRLWVRQTDALQLKLLLLGEEETIYSKQSKSIRLALMDLFTPVAQFSEHFLALARAEFNATSPAASQAVLSCLNSLAVNTSVEHVSDVMQNQIPALHEPLKAVASQIDDPLERAKVLAILSSLKKLINCLLIYREARRNPTFYPMRSLGKLVNRKVALADAVGVMCGYLLFCWFWVTSEWAYGPFSLMIFLSIIMLQLPTDRPLSNVIGMLKGFVLALLTALPIKFILMPIGESGFVWLFFCMAIAILPGCLLRVRPKTMAVGAGYFLFSLAMFSITNNMDYDIVSFMNIMLALLVSIFASFIVVAVIHPWRGETRLNLLMKNAIDDFNTTVMATLKNDQTAIIHWQDRQFARVKQLDHIIMLRKPLQADDAAQRLFNMTDAVLRLQHEIALAKSEEHTSQMPEIDWLIHSNMNAGHDNLQKIGMQASAIAKLFFRNSHPERSEAWHAICQDLTHLERRTYV